MTINSTKPLTQTLVGISSLDSKNKQHIICGKTFDGDNKTIYIVIKPQACVYKFNRRLMLFFASQKKAININVDSILQHFSAHERLTILYGIFSADAMFNRVINYKTTQQSPIQHNFIIRNSNYQKWLKEVEVIVDAQSFAMELMQMPGNMLTTSKFIALIKQKMVGLKNLSIDILDQKILMQKQMGLILAVGQASTAQNTPCIMHLHYQKNKKTNNKLLTLIGKGLVFDTGGLNLKPSPFMARMNADMSAAAIVAATIYAAAKLEIVANVSGLLPLASNEIGPNAYRVNDVLKSYDGYTIEITNTDAEGRLVLADAISYARKDLHADTIFTIATLTGGVLVAFGDVYTPIWSTSDHNLKQIVNAANIAGEAIWHMPFHFAYAETLESKIADYINCYEKRDAQSTVAAEFLKLFAHDTNFVHADIAGTSEYLHHYVPVLVRTLFHFTKNFKS